MERLKADALDFVASNPCENWTYWNQLRPSKSRIHLVLGRHMSRVVSIVLGACVFAIVGFFCASGLSHIYQTQFAKSQGDMDSFAVFLVLAVIPAFFIGGGVLGFLGHRRLTRRSAERPDKQRNS